MVANTEVVVDIGLGAEQILQKKSVDVAVVEWRVHALHALILTACGERGGSGIC